MSTQDTFNVMMGGDFRILRWIEIEGLPYCYGTGPGAIGGSFFAARAAAQQFLGIRCWLESPPPIEDVELDVLDAFPKAAGALQAKIVDVDGSVTALVNTNPGNARLSADITPTTASIVYAGTDPGFGSSGVAYIGNETIQFTTHNTGTQTLGGITRGRFRSVPRAWGRGIPIHCKPYTMAKRRVWYFTIASAADPSLSYFGFDDTNRWLRFAGTLESLRSNDQLTGFEIKATTLEKDLDRVVFANLRSLDGPADSKIRGVGGTEGLDVGATWSAPSTSAKLKANELVPCRIGDEIVTVQRVASTEFLRLLRRGLFNTPVEEHAAGQTMKEIVAVCPGLSGDHTATNPATGAENEVSYFSSYGDPGSNADGGGTWFPPDHPLAVLLTVMLTGHDFGLGANNSDGNGWSPPLRAFDIDTSLPGYAPKEWWLGIDCTRLDLRAICRLANETAWLRVSGVIEDSVNFLEWAKTLLQPFGFYVTYTAAGLFTVKPLRPPLPSSDLIALNDNHRIAAARPGYDANLSAIVSSVEYRYGWDVAEGRFRRIVSLRVNEGDLYSGGRGRSLVYESRLLYTNRERIPGEISREVGFDVNELLQQRGDFYQARFARPPAIVVETVKLDLIGIALGDLIEVTSANSPNPSTGTAGLQGAICEVIGKKIDEEEKTIELTLLLTGFSTGDYRVIGPAAVIAAGVISDSLDFQTDPAGSKFGGRFGWNDWSYPAGGSNYAEIGGNVIAFFPVGSWVRIYPNVGTIGEPRWDFSSFVAHQVIDTSSNNIQIDTVITVSEGDLVCLDTYANQVGVMCGQRAFPAGPGGSISLNGLFAFLANSSNQFSTGDPGHRFFPA